MAKYTYKTVDVHVVDFVNKSKVFSATLNNVKETKADQEKMSQILDHIKLVSEIRASVDVTAIGATQSDPKVA